MWAWSRTRTGSGTHGIVSSWYPLPPSHPILRYTALYRWQARIRIDGKFTNIGTYESEREAARRFDHVARSMGKPTNFNLDGTPGDAKKAQPMNPEKQSKYTGVSWHSPRQR